MMLEPVYGHTKKQFIANQLVETLQAGNLTGTLYIGYPVLPSADDRIEVDALLVSLEYGLVAFHFTDGPPQVTDRQRWNQEKDHQDRLYFALKNDLGRHEHLRKGRDLGIPIETITLFPAKPTPPAGVEGNYCDIGQLANLMKQFVALPEKYFRPLQSALQRVTTIKPPKKRLNVKHEESRGAILKRIEKEIANLDQWQKRAAIETPDGPQRIRGLAGSGKTIILALKAAYLHVQHPDWTIAVTFYTRSLYQQYRDLIRRFTFEHIHDEPNWNNLRVLHSWGGSDRDGVYAQIARHCNEEPHNFIYAKSIYGMDEAFRGVCSELLSIVVSNNVSPMYDAVLIDEAQDLPDTFFKLVFQVTQEPKRIFLAYDELQRLSEASMLSIDDQFGRDGSGRPNIQLTNLPGKARQDLMLKVCYRNTPWALTLAHGLGLGIYRKGGFVQYFDEPDLWGDIGYQVVKGKLTAGEEVVLERGPDSYPAYFTEWLSSDDAVCSKCFSNEMEQAAWVAREIQRNLERDELDIDDILIILPDTSVVRKQSAVIMDALSRHGVSSHLAGVTSSPDEIYIKDSIAIANIFRSKGNEAPMVYVLNCQYCYSGHELITIRNILFTAITRSRSWVRLCGLGREMRALQNEIDLVRENQFRLVFRVPEAAELKKLRRIHRDRTADEKARITKAEKGLKVFLEAISRGDLSMENLPPDVRSRLAKLLARESDGDEGVP